MIDLEKESLLRKQEKIQKKVHVFLCAKQQEMVNEDKQEWEIRKEKAAISRTKEENLEPERNRIGGQLSGYYEYRLSDNKEKQEAIKKQKLQIRKDITQQKDILNEYREFNIIQCQDRILVAENKLVIHNKFFFLQFSIR